MGSVVISVDAELGWGFHDRESPPIHRLDAARDGWRHLLELFDEYRVPATWSVVGHLFLDDCDGVHAAHPTPPDWFARERGAWRDRPDLRFGGDLVTALLDAPADHDVGCHTFSHVVASDPRITADVLRAELAAAIDAGAARGVEYDSFVYPRNAIDHREVLAEFDFAAYRGARRPNRGRVVGLTKKLAAAVDPSRARLVEPFVDEYGMVDVPPSLFLFGFEGRPRTVVETVWDDPVARQAKHGIDRAAREDAVFHMWLHPSDLADRRSARRMRVVLEYVDEHRRESDLQVETMADVAERLR